MAAVTHGLSKREPLIREGRSDVLKIIKGLVSNQDILVIYDSQSIDQHRL